MSEVSQVLDVHPAMTAMLTSVTVASFAPHRWTDAGRANTGPIVGAGLPVPKSAIARGRILTG